LWKKKKIYFLLLVLELNKNMKLEKGKFKKEIAIKSIIMILVAFLGIYSSFYFIGKIELESKKIIIARTEIKKLQILNEKKVQLYEDYNKIKPYLDKVFSFLPKENELVKIISSLEEIAQKNNISQKLKLTEMSPLEDLKRANYEITLSGNYEKILNYCKEFEKSPYFVRMNNLNFYSMTDLEKEAKLSVSIFLFLKK